MNRFQKTLALLAMLFNITDSITTEIALKIGLSEGNPLVAFFLDNFNHLLFHIIKFALFLYIVMPYKYSPLEYLINQKNFILSVLGQFLLASAFAYFFILTVGNLFLIFRAV